MKVSIVTDSTCAPSRQRVRELGISVVPARIIISGKVYRDSIDLQPEELYRLLPTLTEPPTTAAPAPGAFLEAFREGLDQGNRVICFTVTASLSATYNAARQALAALKEGEKESVEIIDTGTAGAGAAVIVMEAARLAGAGAGAPEIIELARRMIPRAKLMGTLDTLEYLQRSGRVNRLAALAGDFLQIKPVFYLNRGKAAPCARARGKRQAISRMLQIFRDDTSGAHRVWLAITHANADEEVRWVLEQLESEFPAASIDIVPFTVAMGSHTGPGVVGLGYTCLK